MYDAIIIGARCAGAPTAMLLARKGYKVLLIDKAEFPSDTISTHIIFGKGGERLKQWGLLDKVLETNCPVIHKMGYDIGPFTLKGTPPNPEGVRGIIAPRRTYLDKILVDAAVEAGAELRENCVVEEIMMNDGSVTGVRCRIKGGSPVTEKARIVIGADGKHSMVAQAVKADEYNVHPSLTCWYYTYFSGVPAKEMILHSSPNRAFGAIPTNDGMVCLPVIWTADEFHEYRSDIEGNYMKTLDLCPELADQVRQGKREERFFGMSDVRNFFRKSFGPGWALVGDAGYHKDPFTGQGISNAFVQAEQLAGAIDKGFSGKESLNKVLARNEQTRDQEMMPMYELTCDWAKLQPPPPEIQNLFIALLENPVESDRFMGAATGTVPIPEFFSPDNIQRIVASGHVA